MGTFTVGEWSYIAGVHHSIDQYIRGYNDGEIIETTTVSGTLANVSDDNTLCIGTESNENVSHDALVDEVRITRYPLDADYFNAQYASMTDTFISYGTIEEIEEYDTSTD